MAEDLIAEDKRCASLVLQRPAPVTTDGSETKLAISKNEPVSPVQPPTCRTLFGRQELQQLLPQVLVLDQQRAIPNCPCQLFDCCDYRLGIDTPVRRTILIVDLMDTEEPTGVRLGSLIQFTELHLNRVAQPLESGRIEERISYVILPWFPAVLADQIPATGLTNRSLAWTLLMQAMEGLGELHRHGFVHGDLRTATIFLDTQILTLRSRAWIGKPDLYQLKVQADRKKKAYESAEISSPESNGVYAALARDDLDALGRVAVELFAGASARRKLESDPQKGLTRATSSLRSQMWWWRRRFLVEPLLSNDHGRPRDACEVLARWQRILLAERLAKHVAVFLVPVSLLVVVILIWGYSYPEMKPESPLASTAANRLDELENALSATRGQLAEKTMELEALRRHPARPPSPSLEAEARDLWRQKFSGRRSNEYIEMTESLLPNPSTGVQHKLNEWMSLTRLVESDLHKSLAMKITDHGGSASTKAYIEFQQAPWDEQIKSGLMKALWQDVLANRQASDSLIDAAIHVSSKFSSGSWLQSELRRFSSQLLQHRAKWARWERQPARLIVPWKRLIETPWDGQAQLAERERFGALEAAEESWRRVVARGDLSWGDFKSQLKDAVGHDPKAAEVTSVWIDQLNQLNGTSKATITLIGGHSPPGFGVYRTIDIHVAGSFSALDDEVSGDTWNTETDHVYSDVRTVSFPWQPGQSIQLYVYGARTVYRGGSRPPLIQRKYTGPVALWLMGQDQQITVGSSEHAHRLQFRVEDCPGPPPPAAELAKLLQVIAH